MQPIKINKLPSIDLPPIDNIADSGEDDSEEELETKQQEPQPFPLQESKEFCSFEFPNGMKIITGSCCYNVFQLADLNFSILDKFEKRNKKPKQNKNYVG